MAQAPIGSCINDPSRDECPPATAMVYDPDFFSIPEDQRPKVEVNVSRNRAKRIIARRLMAYNCGVKFVRESPYKAAGYEQADALNLCFDPISDLDVYMRLDKYYNGQWYSGMASRWFFPTNPNQYPWNGSLRYACIDGSVNRKWRALVDAFALYKGVWYLGEAWGGPNWNHCG